MPLQTDINITTRGRHIHFEEQWLWNGDLPKERNTSGRIKKKSK